MCTKRDRCFPRRWRPRRLVNWGVVPESGDIALDEFEDVGDQTRDPGFEAGCDGGDLFLRLDDR